MVTVVTEYARERLLNEILYAHDLVLMSKSFEEKVPKVEKCIRRQEIESKCWKN